MIYVSIDIETSGLDHLRNNILSIGAIIEDTENKLPFEQCPKFNAIITHREITGQPYALNMNKDIISLISDYINASDKKRTEMQNEKPFGYSFYTSDDIIKEFYHFLYKNIPSENKDSKLLSLDEHRVFKDGHLLPVINGNTKSITINAAGKNFATFDKLFLEQLPWWQKLIKVRQRILDPAILMTDWKQDKSLPGLSLCKTRAGFEGVVTHNALEDAWDVIEILRKQY